MASRDKKSSGRMICQFQNLPGALVALLLAGSAFAGRASAEVKFNRDIRPILSDTCFHCHGPDARARKGEYAMPGYAGVATDSPIDALVLFIKSLKDAKPATAPAPGAKTAINPFE
ncbi:MAG: cytochrome c [Verrucomicrobia bacterium]|nr:cytochrome c [Verrucomicrobiota bacterium]